MAISLQPNVWHVKNSEGNYLSSAILSTTLPQEADAILQRVRSALNTEEIDANTFKEGFSDDLDSLVSDARGTLDQMLEEQEQLISDIRSTTQAKTDAQSAAAAAAQSATAASRSANAAAGSASNALDSANAAGQSANAASQSATAASNSATAASGSATAASNSAAAAAGSASDAQDILDSIPSDYSDLAAKVDDLDNDLSGVIGTLNLQTASGAIVTVDDAFPTTAESLKFEFEPVQDLHGYSKPWPAGSGKNMLPYPYTVPQAGSTFTQFGVTITHNEDGTLSFAGTASKEMWFYVNTYTADHSRDFQFAPGDYILSSGISGETAINGYRFQMTIYKNGEIIRRAYDTGSGANLTINAGETEAVYLYVPSGKNMNGIVIKPMLRFSTVSDATFEPYSNICPISGWTGLSGTRTGKNLIGIPGAIDNTGNINDNTYNLAHGIRSDIIPTTPGTVYSGSKVGAFEETWANLLVRFYDSNKNFIESRTLVSYNAQSGTVTVPNGVYFVSFSVTQGGTSFDGYNVQVEIGSSPTNYEPYQGESISVNWQDQAGTVYSGYVDVISGKMVVDHGIGTADASSSWGYSSSSQRFYINQNDMVLNDANVAFDGMCDMFAPHLGGSAITDNSISYFGTSSARVCFKHTASASVSDWVSFLGDRTITYTYPLATPIEYQLTPQQLSLLRGYNVIWANISSIAELKYRSEGFVTTKVAEKMIEKSAGNKANVITETTSGSIVSFSDGADNLPIKSLTINIESQQDLHGYDHPWPAGSGKNKAAEVAARTLAGITLTVKNNGEVVANGTATQDVVFEGKKFVAEAGNYYLNGCPNGGNLTNTYDVFMWDVTNNARPKRWNGTTAADSVFNSSEQAEVKIEADHQYSTRIRLRSGYNANNVIFRPMLRLASVSDATFEPYSNICPISGWTGLNGAMMGKNVFPYNLSILKTANTSGTWTGNVYSYQGLIYTVVADNDGNVTQIDVSGTLTANDHFFYIGGRRSYARTHMMKPGRYIATGYSTPYKLRVGKGEENTFVGNYDTGSTIELTGDTYEFGLRIQNASGQAINTTLYPMLRLATDTGSIYEPPYSDTISVNWQDQAGTVYGGTVDVVSGKMTLTHKTFEIDGITAGKKVVFASSWNTDETHQNCAFGYGNNGFDAKYVYGSNEIVDCISDIFTPTSYNGVASVSAVPKYGIFTLIDGTPTQGSKIRTCIPKSLGITTVDQMNDWIVSNGGFTITYRLLNPIEYQLTPQEVTTLLGTNNIWVDCGDISVTYAADTKLYIERLTQPTEDDMTADHAISAGMFFMIGNTLYLATSQIAAGGTITPGTNATKLSLADALNQLNT